MQQFIFMNIPYFKIKILSLVSFIFEKLDLKVTLHFFDLLTFNSIDLRNLRI
jgi:hypothetical protein